MAASVEATFRLYDRASPVLRRISREAKIADQNLRDVGASLDQVGAGQPQLTGMQQNLRGVGQATTQMERQATTAYRNVAKETDNLASKTTNLTGVLTGGRGGGGGGPISGGIGGAGGMIRGGLAGGFAAAGGRALFMASALAVAAPAVVALSGAVGALVASLGAAAGGAGAVGAGALGAAAVGVGSLVGIIKPAITTLKEARKAQEAYNKAVQQYGDRSKQAQDARRARDELFKQNKGVKEVITSQRQMSKEWREQTASSRELFFGTMAKGIALIRREMPTLSSTANRSFRAVNQEVVRIMDRLDGRYIRDFGDTFARGIGPAIRGTADLARSVGRIAHVSRPFLLDTVEGFRGWGNSADRATRDTDRLAKKVGSLVGHTKDWGRLFGATGRLIGSVLRPATGQGQDMVRGMTAQLNRWSEWLNRHPGEVYAFFDRAIDSTVKLGKALGAIATTLVQVSDGLLPVLNGFSQLTSFLGPDVLGALGVFAAGRMVAGRLPGRGRGSNGGTATTPAGTGSRGVPVPGIAPGGTSGGANPALADTLMAAGAGAAAANAPGWARSWQRAEAVARNAPPGMGALQRSYAHAHNRPPQGWLAPRQPRRMPRMPRIPGAVRSIGSKAGPLALAFGGYEFLTAQGGIDQKAYSAIDAAMFGFASPLQESGVQSRDAGVARARNVAARGSSGSIRRRMAQLQSRLAQGERRTILGDDTLFGVSLGGGKNRRQDQRRMQAELRQLRLELPVRLRVEQNDRKLREQAKDALSRATGAQKASEFAQGFNQVIQRGLTPEKAFGKTQRGILQRMSQMRPAGARVLARNALAWARQMAKDNPKLKGQVDQLSDDIDRRLRRMGRNARVVGGRVYTDLSGSWKNLRSQLNTENERMLQSTQKNFTAIQRETSKVLRAMGYNPRDANNIVRDLEAGGSRGRRARRDADAGPTGAGQRPSVSDANNARSKGYSATGSRVERVPGMGLQDTVPVAPGHIAAPGELIINRHTERDHDRDARQFGLPTLDQRVRGERRRHSAPIGGPDAADARDRARRQTRRGAPGALMGAAPHLAQYAAKASRYGLQVTSGLRRGSVTSSGNTSLHASGHAIDVSGRASAMMAFARSMASQVGRQLEELIYTPLGFSIKNGRRVPPYAQADHYDHVHVGDRGGGGALGGVAVGGGFGMAAPRLKRPRARRGGIFGVAEQLATDAVLRGAQRLVNRAAASGDGRGDIGAGVSGSNMEMGRRMMLQMGWGPDQWSSLKRLWQGESGWNETARNPSSGAYGIPQSLPASKMGQAAQGVGPVAARAQIRWGLRYIKDRYGSPSAALAAWSSRSPHWYATGGRVGERAVDAPTMAKPEWGGWHANGGSFTARRPTLIGVGERGHEDVDIRPRSSGKARRAVAGGGLTINGGINVEYKQEGDVVKAVRKEVEKLGMALVLAPDEDDSSLFD